MSKKVFIGVGMEAVTPEQQQTDLKKKSLISKWRRLAVMLLN